jgi:hypothetical protein
VRTFTDALVAEALFGNEPSGGPPELVIGVEDLELANIHQPEVVTRCIRRGVDDYFVRHPLGSSRTEDRYRERLRTRCSFHLLVPMPEAYFFGERAALERAGVAADVRERLCCEDLEAFETDDPEFIRGRILRPTGGIPSDTSPNFCGARAVRRYAPTERRTTARERSSRSRGPS